MRRRREVAKRRRGAASPTSFITWMAHTAVTQPHKDGFIAANPAEQALFDAEVKRITLARACRDPLPTEYRVGEPAPARRLAEGPGSVAVTLIRARPRERRFTRHVARSTSSADSPADDPPEPPQPPRYVAHGDLLALYRLLNAAYADVAFAWALDDDLDSAVLNLGRALAIVDRALFGIETEAA